MSHTNLKTGELDLDLDLQGQICLKLAKYLFKLLN